MMGQKNYISVVGKGRRFLARSLRWAARRVASEEMPSPADSRLDAAAASWNPPKMPDWVVEELVAASMIEPDLLPHDDAVDKFQFYSVPQNPAPGIVYSQALEQLSSNAYTHVLVIPWLKPGGADRGILFHVNAILEHDADAKVLMIATEPSESQWKYRVPTSVDYLELGLLSANLELPHQVVVLTRLLIQLQPRTIHIVNSKVGWMAVRSHGLALGQSAHLFGSLFCDDYNVNMKPVGYARDFLRDTYRYFDRIFCDNTAYPRIWSNDLGVPQDVFSVLPFPYDGEVSESRIQKADANRVLWAGRLDRQKRLDVLLEIARLRPELHFDVYGAPVMGESMAVLISELGKMPNVELHGTFERLEDVVTEQHFAFLMTTSWEGTPTILLDVAALRLPIVAPAVGGIPDIVNARHLVSNPDDAGEFSEKLVRLKSDAVEAASLIDEQVETIQTDRAWTRFIKRLEEKGTYFTGAGSDG
ncbi:glycosyltransferase [Luteimonas sp. FXH3W]|uniref:Glycosyltransferase n=1 Tax=Aquilutibacter rugosus TaxID=3115820 RepID=A0ABU7UXH9_9GAMM